MSDSTGYDATQHARPLWAPWRIEYIKSLRTPGCFLCREGSDGTSDGDGLLVARGEAAFVILNAFPYNSGHALVAPYRHVPDLTDLSDEERCEIMGLIVRARRALQHLMEPEGFNIGINLGAPAGAGLAAHLHAHVVPRWNGDTNFMPVVGGVRVVPEALCETAKALRAAWKTVGDA